MLFIENNHGITYNIVLYIIAQDNKIIAEIRTIKNKQTIRLLSRILGRRLKLKNGKEGECTIKDFIKYRMI